MSYDVLFVPRRPGQDWDEALDAAEALDTDEQPLDADRLAQWDRVLRAVRDRAGEVEVTEVDDAREAVHRSGLQVCLYANEAAVSFPVREREDAAAFHDLVVDVVGIVEQETALQAYDAQTGISFDGDLHVDGLEADDAERPAEPGTAAPLEPVEPDVAGGATAVPSGSEEPVVEQPADEQPVDEQPPGEQEAAQLVALRPTAVRYSVLGLVIIVVGLLLRSAGTSSVLVDIAMLIGVADLVIGGLAWLSYRRRRG